jgi:hypothetical protein
MTEILIYSSVYGIFFLSILNFLLIVLAAVKKKLQFVDAMWMGTAVIAILLLSLAIFFRDIMKMHWLFYAVLLVSIMSMIGMFLNLTGRMMKKRN